MDQLKYKIPKRRLILIARLFMLCLGLFNSFYSLAQDKIIPVLNGTVKSETDERLSGATVFVQGTSVYTITKKDGTFQLKNVPENATLRISFVGYITASVK